jgi:hypothetical protein
MLGAGAALLLALATPAMAWQDGGAQPGDPLWQTKSRLPPERMITLVGGAVRLVEAGDLPAGKEAFQRLLAAARAEHGARSVEAADLLESFGVRLYVLSVDSDNPRLRGESLPYLEAAIPAYRAAFGNAHPEVALALNSYADVQLILHPDDPPESAVAALDEAYGMRLNALGATNIETLATLRNLARLRGHPARTRGNRALIEASARLFRLLVARSSDDRQLGDESGPSARTAFARMYARNRLPREAREQLRLGIAQAGGWPALERCEFAANETAAIERILAGRGNRRAEIGATQDAALDACFAAEGVVSD